jgi:hypothetical protein
MTSHSSQGADRHCAEANLPASAMRGMLVLVATQMATENEPVPPSTAVSPFDLQLSACAIEGQQTGRAEAHLVMHEYCAIAVGLLP